LASVLFHTDSEPGPDTEVCAIVVLYEDNSSRAAAIRLCNSLEKIFHTELDFEITWCRFKYVNDPAVAAEAAPIAAHADLIIVAIQRADDLPLEVKAWFECWLPHRNSEGALVLLQSSENSGSTISQTPYLYLLAQRANLDFISLSDSNTFSTEHLSNPNELPKDFPSPTRCREGQGEGSVRSEHYSRFGINE
jgi:hypothetical protein